MDLKSLKTKLQLVAAVGLLSVGGMAGVPSAPAHATTLAVVFPPWWTQAQIWNATRGLGDVVDTGAAPFVMIVHSEAPNFKQQAQRFGALLVLDPLGVGGCGPRSSAAIG